MIASCEKITSMLQSCLSVTVPHFDQCSSASHKAFNKFTIIREFQLPPTQSLRAKALINNRRFPMFFHCLLRKNPTGSMLSRSSHENIRRMEFLQEYSKMRCKHASSRLRPSIVTTTATRSNAGITNHSAMRAPSRNFMGTSHFSYVLTFAPKGIQGEIR